MIPAPFLCRAGIRHGKFTFRALTRQAEMVYTEYNSLRERDSACRLTEKRRTVC